MEHQQDQEEEETLTENRKRRGRMLLAAKEQCINERVPWLEWLERETGIPERTARLWMEQARDERQDRGHIGKIADMPQEDSVNPVPPDTSEENEEDEGDDDNRFTAEEWREEEQRHADNHDYEDAIRCRDKAVEASESPDGKAADPPPSPPPPPPKYPYSEMLVDWLKKVTDQTNYIHIERGGLSALLAEPKKFNRKDVKEYILPMLEAVSKTIADYRKELEIFCEKG